MTVEEIVARAAPPPERADAAVFEPVATDPASLARRRQALTDALGGEVAPHAEALGLTPEAWFGRFGDVRLAGPAPDWARAFAALFERLSEGERSFAQFRAWAAAEAVADWPAELPSGPDVLQAPLDYLAGRLSSALGPLQFYEQRLGHAPTWQDRFRRYPALAFALGRVTADWLADLARMMRRAAADRALLSQTFFGGAPPGALTAIEMGLGDPHRGGRSVAILRFERGAVVYKPKDLRIAAALGAIARPFAEAGLAEPESLLRDGYAWEPVHTARPVAGREEADGFFAALGGWLALLQALGATDFWFDNLIADGPVPRFVDFETATQPGEEWPRGIRRLVGKGAELATTMPLGVGILPLLMPADDGEEAIDIGCLVRPGEHRTPMKDVAGAKPITWREDRHAPRHAPGAEGAGAPADAAEHFDAFEAGYLRIARALADPQAQERTMQALRSARDATIRHIRIDTWTCYRVIQHSFAPRYLSDGVWREIALHDTIPSRDRISGVLREAAVRDLRRLDVPLFQTTLGSRDLSGVEGERSRNFFPRDAVSETGRRLRALAGLADEERVAWLRSGFALRAGNPPWRRPTAGRLAPAGTGDLMAWADEIASELTGLAVSDEAGRPTWFGLYHDVFSGWRTVGPLGFDMLSGRAGLAMALLELGRRLDRSDLATLARETLAGAGRDYVDHAVLHLSSGAGHAVGAGGLAMALAEAGLRAPAAEVWAAASAGEVWMRSGEDFPSGLAGWRAAAEVLGESAPERCGTGRPYAPSAVPRLVRWLAPADAAPLCDDPAAAARRRRDRDRHGSWFAAEWLDDRHNLSGIDGLPALAVAFARLADGSDPGTSAQ